MKKLLFNKKKLIYNILRRSMIILSSVLIMFLISCTSTSNLDTQITIDSSVPTTRSLEQSFIYDTFKSSVFRIDSKNYDGLTVKQGTGYILKADGTFVTNAHVIKNVWTAKARFDVSDRVYNVEGIYYYDEESDIAIGKLELVGDFEPIPIEFADEYNLNDIVYSVGYPNYAEEAVITEGEILSTYFTSDIYNMVYIRTDSVIRHGSSGGILASADGKVLGITSVSFSDGTFGSIRGIEYSTWQTDEPDNLLSLTNYFHPSYDILINKDNFEDYFTIRVDEISAIYDEEAGTILINYLINGDPDIELELIEDYSYIFVALSLRVDYYYLDSINYELKHHYTEAAVSLRLDGYYINDHEEEEITIYYDADDIITSYTYTYNIVFVEGYVTIYE